MALVTAGISVVGRVRLPNPTVANASYILLLPGRPEARVRFEGTWELLRFNTPLNSFVQILTVPIWVDAHFIAGVNIPNVNHRFSFVWRYPGISYQVHTA